MIFYNLLHNLIKNTKMQSAYEEIAALLDIKFDGQATSADTMNLLIAAKVPKCILDNAKIVVDNSDDQVSSADPNAKIVVDNSDDQVSSADPKANEKVSLADTFYGAIVLLDFTEDNTFLAQANKRFPARNTSDEIALCEIFKAVKEHVKREMSA